jgi:hypothetical protein
MIDNSTKGAEDYKHAYLGRKYHFEFSVKENQWIRGKWNMNKEQNSINFYPEVGNNYCFTTSNMKSKTILLNESDKKSFYPISDSDIVNNLTIFNFFFRSRAIMERNLREKRTVVNDKSFGKAVVFKNFEIELPLHV